MGLDLFASRSPDEVVLTGEDEESLAALGLVLNGWVGGGSFSARRYLEVIGRVAGVMPGYRWISPGEVARMAAAFEARDADEVARQTGADAYPATADEVRALRRLFRLCANRGLGLLGM